GREVFDVARVEVEAVNAAHRPDVDVSPLILDDATRVRARKPLRGRIDGWRETVRRGVVNTHDAAAIRRHPEPPRAVEVGWRDRARRHAVGLVEEAELPALEVQQVALFDADPDADCAV